MKRLTKSLTAALMAVWCMGQAFPVYASGNPAVVLESAGASLEDRTLKVACNIENADQVTNGKVRVTYDQSQLKLLENQTGRAISDSDALCEVNDCITGNKEEGEIVYAFASSKEMPSEGCLANMSFAIFDQTAAGDEIKIKVSVENIAGKTGELQSESKNLTIKVEEKEDNSGNNGDDENNPGDNTGDNKRPGITGNDRKDTQYAQGSRSSGSSISGGSASGSRSQISSSNSGGTVRSSIGNSQEGGTEEMDIENNISDMEDEEDASSEGETELKSASDEKIPLAGIRSGSFNGWMIPLAAIGAAIVVFLVYKKKKKQ